MATILRRNRNMITKNQIICNSIPDAVLSSVFNSMFPYFKD